MPRPAASIALRSILALSIAVSTGLPADALGLPSARPAPATPIRSALDQLGLARIILAQTVDHPDKPDGGQNTRNGDGVRPGYEEYLSPVMTRKIIKDIESIQGECGSYDEIYRIDCLRQGLEMVATAMPDTREYRDAKRILRKASSRLSRIVAQYQDTTAPKLEVPAKANPRFKKRRRYAAIRREALPAAMAKARSVVEEATTELLRSGENSEKRYAHYQQISVAVDSTKVLLRS